MTTNVEIAVLKQQLAKAEVAQNAWHAGRKTEKYLEACSTVQALELQIERATLRHSELLESRARLGLEDQAHEHEAARISSIWDNGRTYQYREYHYDRLEDAVNFARTDHTAQSASDKDATLFTRIPLPGEADRALMAQFGITYERGVFSRGEYRYHLLADAVAYARLQ